MPNVTISYGMSCILGNASAVTQYGLSNASILTLFKRCILYTSLLLLQSFVSGDAFLLTFSWCPFNFKCLNALCHQYPLFDIQCLHLFSAATELQALLLAFIVVQSYSVMMMMMMMPPMNLAMLLMEP